MKERQRLLIDKKFQDLMAKLEERKNAITKDILTKYDNALFKINDKIRAAAQQGEEVEGMQDLYKHVIDSLGDDTIFENEGSHAQVEILNKVPEYENMIHQSSQKIKNFLHLSRNMKIEIAGGESLGLKPIEISVQNALNLIQTIQLDSYNGFAVSDYQLPPFA